MENNSIDKYFSSRLSDVEVTLVSDGWQRVEDLLDPMAGKSMKLIWFILFLVLAALASFYYLNTSPRESHIERSILPIAMGDEAIKTDLSHLPRGKPTACFAMARRYKFGKSIFNRCKHRGIEPTSGIKDNTQNEIIIENVHLVPVTEPAVKERSSTDLSATIHLPIKENRDDGIASKNLHPEKISRLAYLKPLPVSLPKSISVEEGRRELKEIHPIPFFSEPRIGRILVINLIKKPNRDTVIMTAPNRDGDANKSVLAAIKESPSEGGIFDKFRKAKIDLFNKKD